MTARDIKFSINQILDNTKDHTVLEAYYEILKNLIKVQKNQVVGYDVEGEAITRKVLEKNVTGASMNIENGNFIRHEDLKKDIENW